MRRFFIFTILILLFSNTLHGQVVINELASSNENTIEDAFGKTSDWLELHNTSNEPINLGAYYLSDYEEYLPMWEFPNITIPANGYLLLFCSGENVTTPGELHTNFKLSQSGETVFLSDPEGNIVSSLEYPYIPTDQSLATYNQQFSEYLFCAEPTPGESNAESTGLYYSHTSGYYDEPFELKIYSPNTENSIHYTRNGNLPATDNPQYSNPIEIGDVSETPYTISSIPTTPGSGPPNYFKWPWLEPESVYKSNVIRAGTFETDSLKSKIISLVYFVDPAIQNRYKYPIISLITDSLNLFDADSGMYIPGASYDETLDYHEGNCWQDGEEWERQTYITYIDTTGEPIYETYAGIRTRGWGSAGFSQKSLNVYFRKEYGLNKIESPLFSHTDTEVFKRLVLRNGGNDFPTAHFKDSYLSRVISDLNVETQDYEPAVLFINGEYWGMINMREKIDRHYFKYKYDLPEESINVLSICGSVEDGSASSYSEVTSYIASHDLANDEAYAFVSERLDIESTIDYNIAEIYFANYDWPCNNYKMWKADVPGGKWKYIIHDLDYTLGFNKYCTYDFKSMEHAVSTEEGWPYCGCANFIFRNLLKNESFVNQFIERFEYCYENVFNPGRMNRILDEFEESYEKGIQEHIARFGYPASVYEWREHIDFFREFINKRPCYMRRDLMNFFQLETFSYYCPPHADLSDQMISTPESAPPEETVIPKPEGWTVYPNPNKGIFKIHNNSGEDFYQGEIQIYNSLGQNVYSIPKLRIRNNSSYQISVPGLANGIYTLKIHNASREEIVKFMVVN